MKYLTESQGVAVVGVVDVLVEAGAAAIKSPLIVITFWLMF
jgi:hypothetical protein